MDANEETKTGEISLDLFHPKKAELVGLADKYKGLSISGVDDKEGYKTVHEARMVLVKARTGINATRKAYTKQFDEAKARAMDLEKELLGLIAPVERSLLEKEEAIDAEKERIRQEALRKEQERTDSRIRQLAAYGYAHDLFELRAMDDEAFESLVESKKSDWEESERIRLEKEEKDRIEREEFERKKAEQDERERELAERDRAIREAEEKIRLESEEKARKEELERAAEEAAERSRIETEKRIERERAELEMRQAKERSDALAAEKAESERIEKGRKYKAWLERNGVTDDGSWKITQSEDGKKRVLWKKVSEFDL